MVMIDKIEKVLLHSINNILGLLRQPTPPPALLSSARLIAHRGCWDNQTILENTFAAFDWAIDLECWGIEFDIRWTQDSIPVVHHDQSLQRVFSIAQNIEDLTFIELRNLVPHVPSLEEVIRRYGNKVKLFIEIKGFPSSQQFEVLQKHLSHLDPVQFYFMSFKGEVLKALTNLFQSSHMVGIARLNTSEMLTQAIRENWGGLTGHYLLMNDSRLAKANSHNIMIGTGFPDRLPLFFREINRGVPWIFTNHLPLYRQYDQTSFSKASVSSTQ